MSGGGRSQIRGRMGKDSKSDVVMSDAEFNDMQGCVERLQNRENELLEKIRELENRIKNHTRQISADRDCLELKSLELQVRLTFMLCLYLCGEKFSSAKLCGGI